LSDNVGRQTGVSVLPKAKRQKTIKLKYAQTEQKERENERLNREVSRSITEPEKLSFSYESPRSERNNC